MNFTVVQYAMSKRKYRKILGLLLSFAIMFTVLIGLIEMRAPNTKIHHLFDALWFSVSSMTSVGYGDIVPVTVIGKLIGMILQLIGALMFGIMIALIGLVLNRVDEEFIWRRMRDRFDDMEARTEKIEKHLTYLIELERQTHTKKTDK